MATRACVQCGAGFEAKPKPGIQRMYCSSRCKDKACYVAQPVRVHDCVTCGKSFDARASGRSQKYCGSKCRNRAMYVLGRGPVAVRHCVVCMGTINSTARKYFCSTKCKRVADRVSQTRAYKPRRYAQRSCVGCGAAFEPRRKSSKYCSMACFQRSPRMQSLRRWHGHVRRARKRGNGVSGRFDVTAVFRRDNYTCQLCGIKTPKRLVGKLPPNAPTLDHIIPLSKGGSHSPDNVQCACRRCNSVKHAKVRGQLRLVLGEVA